MVGISFTQTQSNGVVTTFATILDIRWQPLKSADVQIGFFLTEAGFLSGDAPVCTQYVPLDITKIDPTLAIPPQLVAQITATGAICAGGTPV